MARNSGEKKENSEGDRSPESPKKKESTQQDGKGKPLAGTTLRVYRLLYKEGTPLGINEVQRKAGLSTSSLAYYHLNKLAEEGLAKQKDGRYVVDRVVFENMIRVRRSLIPIHATFTAFFATMIVGLLILFGPHSSSYPAIF
ncbi:MAG: winged helix-turn-helix transcriptional regulator, partial [Nitrososphaerota archaeon]|nr:winged helix-turn-helix transcriptional regulator [Nitrososphaerota archaeon]